jgi:threonine dehydrogenase-like Zn-dependent dehydrogenase
MCERGWFAQCETTQVRSEGKGATLFGYTSLYGAVPGGQAEYLRVPQAQFGPIKIPDGTPDEQFLFLSDVLPTAWQAVAYADIPDGGSVAVFGLGPIGQMCVRIAKHLGAGRVIGIDSVPERLALAERWGAEPLDLDDVDDPSATLLDLVDGRGPDSTIDAVGMESHGGAPGGRIASLGQKATGLLPDPIAQKITDKFAVDRLDALLAAIKGVRRAGTVSISGVYGGEIDAMPMMEMFDRGITMRMGQAHVRRWTDDILPLVLDPADPLGTLDLVTHHVPLADAPGAYEMFRDKADGCIKVVLHP